MSFEKIDVFSLIPHAVAISVVLIAYFRLKSGQARNLITSALALVGPLQARIAEVEADLVLLKRRIADLEYENAELWRWGRINYGKVVGFGGDPEPIPTITK